MKIKSALLSLAAITMLSCSQKKNGYKIDCDYKKKQAQNQFNYKNYTWTLFSSQGYDYLGEEEFIQLLAQHQIKAKKISLSCLKIPNEQYENCEEDEMNRLILQKFGKGFIDSLRYISKQNFIKNHPEEIMSYERCDYVSRYPNTTRENESDKIQTDYFSKYSIPKEYIRQKGDSDSYTSASFVLTKNGEIKDLSVESTFRNSKNKKFEKQFNKQFKNFILQTKWLPATMNKVNVNTYCTASILYY